MKNIPKTAMILAAGYGKRMRPLTNNLPKPLVKVAGKCLIDYTLDNLVAAGVERAVINVSYLAEMLEEHLKSRTDIAISISHEPEPLETGGGILKALPLIGSEPFIVCNSDIIWIDLPHQIMHLKRLADRWSNSPCKALLSLCPLSKAHGYHGSGDFSFANNGSLMRNSHEHPATHVFAGIQIITPNCFSGISKTAFPLGEIYFSATSDNISAGIEGIELESLWLHVGDPEAVITAESILNLQVKV